MNKILFLILSALILFCGCKKRQHIGDETAIEASSSVDTAAEQKRMADSIAQAKKDSAEFISFTTPDLKLFFLHGHVKEVIEQSSDHRAGRLSFDKNGKLTYCNLSEGAFRIIRNSKGNIEKFIRNDKDEDNEYISEITYDLNSKGYPIAEYYVFMVWQDRDNFETSKYSKFNEHNWPTRETFFTVGLEDGIDIYWNYSRMDEVGNWTIREEYTTCRDIRKITYYTPEELK